MKHTSPVLKAGQPDDNYKFQPLPVPTGKYTFHLAIENVIPGLTENQMVFHMLGDTGGTSRPEFQQYVVAEIAKQYQPGQFIYITWATWCTILARQSNTSNNFSGHIIFIPARY